MSPDRLACLRDLDIDAFRRYLGLPQLSDAGTLLALHKARTAATEVDPALRLISVEWLRARGYSGFMNAELPPPGELPK